MAEGSGARIPLGDATNVPRKRALPLVPGKFIIGHGAGALDPAKRIRRDSGEGSGNSENLSWKTWHLTDAMRNAPAPSGSSQRPGARVNVGGPGPGFATQEEAGRAASEAWEKWNFPSALNPGLHFIRRGLAAWHRGAGSERSEELVQREEACDVERETGVDAFVDFIGASGYRPHVDARSFSSSLDTMDGEDVTMASSENMNLGASEKWNVESVSQPSTSSGPGAVNLQQGAPTEEHSCIGGDLPATARAHEDRHCSCTVCLRASWLLTDILCKDYKSQFNEVKKIKKAAGIIVGRSFVRESMASVSGKNNKSVKLEHDILQRWRSLFLHTEKVLNLESTILQAKMNKLCDLRIKCERDFSAATGLPASSLLSTLPDFE